MAIIGIIIMVYGIWKVLKYERLKKEGIKSGNKRLYEAAVHKLGTQYIIVVVGLVLTIAGASV